MSKNIKEQIVRSIDIENNTILDKDGNTKPFEPKNAYLLPREAGTHERWVTDDNGVISKQKGGGDSYGIQSIIEGDNINIDNSDTENPVISASFTPTDTLNDVVNRGNYSSKPISFTGVDNNVGSLWYNPSTLSYIFNSSNKQFVGVKNVLIGANTGAMLDTGGSNSIYGNNAGYALTTGSSNSLFGNAAGQGNQNGSTYMYSTFIGAYAGFKSVNGKYNSFVGYNSGGSNTGGDYNTFLGSYAGYYNISGFGNLFLGGASAFIFKYGNSNVVIGQGSGGSKNNDISTPSNRNIYIGRLAGSGVIGDNNVFIGTQSGFVPGSGTTRTVSNKLIIHNRNGFVTSEDDPAATTNTEDTFNTGLITGDFSERWIKFNGKFIVNGSYMPNATGDSTYTKNIVAKPDGTFGWEDRGGSGIIEVTYDELVNLKNNSQLKKGQNYLLTNYMTTYEQPVTNVNKSSGVIEPLIITATDVNKLHNQCKSTLYPQDIVYYEITGDIGNGYGTEGFTKGKIYRRIDTLRNNDIGTDWRHIKYDRNGVDKLLFEDYNYCYNNVIKTYYLFNNVVGNNFFNNTIGDNFFNNTIGYNFHTNIILNNFNNNTIGENFSYNTIGENFSYNTIGENFVANTIGNYFSNNNIIGDSFVSNTIGNSFVSNIIGNYFSNNTVGYNFQLNGNSIPLLSVGTEFRNNLSNVTSTSEIQNENIDVVVFKTSNGIVYQRYYDDETNLVINNLT